MDREKIRKEHKCENTNTGEMRKEREEKGMGRGGQTVKNVSMRRTEFSQSPNDHLKAGSSGALQGVQRSLNPLRHNQGLNQSFLHFEMLLQGKS